MKEEDFNKSKHKTVDTSTVYPVYSLTHKNNSVTELCGLDNGETYTEKTDRCLC